MEHFLLRPKFTGLNFSNTFLHFTPFENQSILFYSTVYRFCQQNTSDPFDKQQRNEQNVAIDFATKYSIHSKIVLYSEI